MRLVRSVSFVLIVIWCVGNVFPVRVRIIMSFCGLGVWLRMEEKKNSGVEWLCCDSYFLIP